MRALGRPSDIPREVVTRGIRHALVATGLLAASTAAIALLETPTVGLPDASPVYLVAVVAMGVIAGTWPAILTAFVSVGLYDFLFTEPRYTLRVADPRDWLDLLLFLFVAVAVGRLAARQAERAGEAVRRARESQALFAVSRLLATAADLDRAAPAIVERLATDARMDRIWIGLEGGGRERILADSRPDGPPPTSPSVATLARTPGDEPARWVRAHLPARRGPERPSASETTIFRVKLESEGEVLGSLWAARLRASGLPSREETRLLALAADQIALAVRREQLAREATLAEIARESDALKSALLDSVSHDLRTPLASIRAAAGSLMDPAVEPEPAERQAAARSIDLEAQRLGHLVRNMLDLSRIEAGALRPDLEVFELRDLVEPVVDRLAPVLADRPVTLELPDDLPLVRADALFFDQILTNLLENAVRYASPRAPIRVVGRERDGAVELTVEDGGPGVPPEAMPRLFEKFYRVEGRREGARRGMGIGLSVVQGLIQAMEGRAEAGPSELGGLAVHLVVPAAAPLRETVAP